MSFGGISDADLPDQVPLANPVSSVPRNARNFQGQRAGVITRSVANGVDFVITVLAVAGCYVSLFVIDFVIYGKSFKIPTPSIAQLFLLWFWITFGYLTIAWATAGRSFGNALLGLRVVNWHGNRVHWLMAALRAAFCVSFVPGFFWAAISPSNRSVQDIVLRTSVIYDWTLRVNSERQIGAASAPDSTAASEPPAGR